MLVNDHISIDVVEMDTILSSNLKEVCRRLSWGGSSGMNRALNHYIGIKQKEGRHLDARGIFAKNWASIYLGWVLFTREYDGVSFRPLNGFAVLQIYVDENHRRKGIGSQLFYKGQTLLRPNEKLFAYCYSEPKFFEPFQDKELCLPI